MLDLYQYSLPEIFLLGLGAILLVSEIGWRLGLRNQGRGDDNVATLESAILGLLALMIGFTFAMALSRFEARRDALLNEANSIGTTALRARLLPEPYRAESLKLLRQYVDIRLDIAGRGTSLAEKKAAIDRSNSIQESLWLQAKAVAAKDTSLIPTGLYIQTLNAMIDDQAKRLAALRNRVPNIVLLGLFGVAAVACGFAGYVSGRDTNRSRIPVFIMGVVVSSVIVLIFDLDRPSSGFITNSQQPMLDTAASIAGFTD